MQWTLGHPNPLLTPSYVLIHSFTLAHCLPGQHLMSQLQTGPPRDEHQALTKQVQPRRSRRRRWGRSQHSLAVEDEAVPEDCVPTHCRPQRRAVSVQQHLCGGGACGRVGVTIGVGDIAVAHAEQIALYSSSSVDSVLARSNSTSRAVFALIAACCSCFPS